MSVNKPTDAKTPDEENAGDGGPSLLERASGAFGLDKLLPARVPAKLPDSKTRRMPAPAQTRAAGDREAVAAAAEAEEAPQPAAAESRRITSPPEGGKPVQFTRNRRKVSHDRLRELGLIDPDLGSSRLVEEFRIVKRQVLAVADAEGTAKSRRILICSPHAGEGKTFCATNLAIALAGERDLEVVLVDADFANPSIMSTFGLENGPGLMDALSDRARPVEDLVVSTDIDGLFLLPAGKRSGSDAEYLASERTWEVLHRLTRGAPNRVVLFDSPPALAASPAAELAKHAGLSLLVARADQTSRAALEDAVDLLSACDDIRLLLNDAAYSPSGRKFGKYYGHEGQDE